MSNKGFLTNYKKVVGINLVISFIKIDATKNQSRFPILARFSLLIIPHLTSYHDVFLLNHNLHSLDVYIL